MGAGGRSQYADGDQYTHGQGGGEDARMGDERGGAVGVDDLLRTGEYCRTDGGADDTGDQHLGENTQALELTGFACRREVPDIGTEDRHAGQVAAHHQQASHKHGKGAAGEVEDNVAKVQGGEGHEDRKPKALPVVDLAPEGGDHCGQDDGRGHDEDVVGHAQADLIVEDQVGHIGLDGDVEEGKDDQHDVEFFVSSGRGGTETVGQVFEIPCFRRLDLRFINEEQTGNAHADDHTADDGEDPGPAFTPVQIKAHKAAEDHQNGNQGHHGVDALHGTAIGMVGGIRDPGIEGGIVGTGAEEGHDAVQDDDQADTQGHGIGGHGEDRLDDIHPEQAEAQNADAPDQIAATDQNFPLADPIGQGTDQHGGHRGGHAGGSHHGGNVRSGSPEHFVNEHIEVHILHDPGHLTHQGKQSQCHPEPG